MILSVFRFALTACASMSARREMNFLEEIGERVKGEDRQ